MIAGIKEPNEILVLDRYLKETLSKLGVAKSKGNPVGEYAEYLAATAFSGLRMANATEGHDLTLASGDRIEVKGRIFEGSRVPKTDIKHSIIDSKTFDYLIYIVFDEAMGVKYAMKISHSDFQKIARYTEHKNSPPKWVFLADPKLLDSPYVENITDEIRAAANKSLANTALLGYANSAELEELKIQFELDYVADHEKTIQYRWEHTSRQFSFYAPEQLLSDMKVNNKWPDKIMLTIMKPNLPKEGLDSLKIPIPPRTGSDFWEYDLNEVKANSIRYAVKPEDQQYYLYVPRVMFNNLSYPDRLLVFVSAID